MPLRIFHFPCAFESNLQRIFRADIGKGKDGVNHKALCAPGGCLLMRSLPEAAWINDNRRNADAPIFKACPL
jgi:hypothetical protein